MTGKQMNELRKLLAQYLGEKEIADAAAEKMKELRDPLVDIISSEGDPVGEKSYKVSVDGIEGKVTVIRSTRVSPSAESILRRAGVWDRVCTQVPDINKIDELFASGVIDAKLMSKVLVYSDSSYRLSVSREKE